MYVHIFFSPPGAAKTPRAVLGLHFFSFHYKKPPDEDGPHVAAPRLSGATRIPQNPDRCDLRGESLWLTRWLCTAAERSLTMYVCVSWQAISRLSALDTQPMNKLLGFGAKYLNEKHSSWVKEQGGYVRDSLHFLLHPDAWHPQTFTNVMFHLCRRQHSRRMMMTKSSEPAALDLHRLPTWL